MVRPRGWHLPEKHILVDGKSASGALMDFAIYFFNSAQALVKRGSGKNTNLPLLRYRVAVPGRPVGNRILTDELLVVHLCIT